MNKTETTLVASLALVLVCAGYGSWLFLFSRPGDADIAAKRQPPQPLPVVTVDNLSQSLQGLEVKGSLPIGLENAGLGRQDPFANQ